MDDNPPAEQPVAMSPVWAAPSLDAVGARDGHADLLREGIDGAVGL